MPALLPSRFDRYTRISELGDTLHRVLKPGLLIIAALLLALVVKMFFAEQEGWVGLAMISVGTWVALAVWQYRGLGLPLIPLVAIQHFAVYGIPLINRNKAITSYPGSMLDKAGLEVMIFLVACSLAWAGSMQLFRPGRPVAYVLRIFALHGNKVLNRVGIGLICLAASYELLNALHLINVVLSILPGGTGSIVSALVGAAGMSGYFLVAMFVSSGEARPTTQTTFWVILVLHLLLLASSILLFTVVNIIGAVVIGLFWGSGRVPRRFLFICCGLLAFLNVGKYEMRDRYWVDGAISDQVTLTALPAFFVEWAGHSAGNLFGSDPEKSQSREDAQMLARMDNLQSLLFVTSAVDDGRVALLNGATYTLIPPLLIPRIFWEDKPRAHEGQVMLNVHFGRQSLEESVGTYIAWGLLPEAYGNFGSIFGGIVLGVALGLIFAWFETATATKPLLSLEGMVAFAVFIGIASSYEMVSSVMVTSLFQSVIVISLACLPFVESMSTIRPNSP